MLITVARTEMAPEAHILRGRLEAEGIPAFIQHEHHVTMDWLVSNALGGVRIQVPVEHAQEAATVLRAIDQGELQLADDLGLTKADVATAGDDAELPETSSRDSNPACPDCGQPGNVRTTAGRGLALALLVFYALPWPWRRAHWRCSQCGKTWSNREHQPYLWGTVLAWMVLGGLLVGATWLLLMFLGQLLGVPQFVGYYTPIVR